MSTLPLPLSRRTLIGALAAFGLAAPVLPIAARAEQAMAAEPFPNGPELLVAGPAGGQLDRWSAVIAPALSAALPNGASVRATASGGVDGVTAANQFDARVAPDGRTVMLVPGEAALAWLAGDPRAQFDPERWVPVLAGATPGLLVGRIGSADLGRRRRPRIAATAPAGVELPALLGLDLMGADPEPMFGMDVAGARNAYTNGQVDLVFLRGTDVPAQLAGLEGARTLFSLGTLDDSGARVRDPLFPDAPTMEEVFVRLRGHKPAGPLYDAWSATAAATALAFGLVLPELTPAGLVSLWRQAGSAAAGADAVQTAAAQSAVRPLATPVATVATLGTTADAPALLALRRWLATRYRWMPR